MAGKRDPHRYGIMCSVPTELAAKIKSYVSGRSVPNKGREGQKVHTPLRPMAMSDLLIALAEEKLKDQEVLPQYANWGDMIRNHNRKARAANDREARK